MIKKIIFMQIISISLSIFSMENHKRKHDKVEIESNKKLKFTTRPDGFGFFAIYMPKVLRQIIFEYMRNDIWLSIGTYDTQRNEIPFLGSAGIDKFALISADKKIVNLVSINGEADIYSFTVPSVSSVF